MNPDWLSSIESDVSLLASIRAKIL